MLPTNTAVKIDDTESEFHGQTGFIVNNSNSGIIEPCEMHTTLRECRSKNCTDGTRLPNGWYELVFDPLDTNGFAYCSEWFKEENLVVNGC